MSNLSIINYMAGLTGFILEEDVLLRIAHDRHISEDTQPCDLSQRDKDLLLADILFTVLCSPSELPSRSRQHGQFSETIGKQAIGNRQMLYDTMLRLYGKWNDGRLAFLSGGGLRWIDESE